MTADVKTRDSIRSIVENFPGICQLKPEEEECLVHILNGGDVVALLKFNLSTVINRQRETGEAKVWQGDNCYCVPFGCPNGRSR